MCVLIAKPSNVSIPKKEYLENCWETNPDGAGFAYSYGEEIVMRKGFMTFADFEKAINEVDLYEVPCIIHFRIATHGTVKPENTHPFVVNDDVVAAHNGILSVKNEGDMTDSETFFKRICAPILNTYPLDSLEFGLMVNSIIGSSKLAFLDRHGFVKIYGDFHEHEGVYYSNYSYEDFGGYGRYYSKSCSTPNKNSSTDWRKSTEKDYELAYDYDHYYDESYYGSPSQGSHRMMDIEDALEIADDEFINEYAEYRRWESRFTDARIDWNDFYQEIKLLMDEYELKYDEARAICGYWLTTNGKTLPF